MHRATDQRNEPGAALLAHYLPSAEFTRAMDYMVEKENPANSIAWPAEPVPAWARHLRVQHLADLGTGVGGETSAMLMRLGQWGCLNDLSEIHLFEHDAQLCPGGKADLAAALEARLRPCVPSHVQATVRFILHTESMTVHGALGHAVIEPIAQRQLHFEFIFASHITYFFGDGSGQDLAHALCNHALKPGGIAWLNIRDQESPAYRARRDTLQHLGMADVQPYDYAEYFLQTTLPTLGARALDHRTVAPHLRPGVDRQEAAELMMWRGRITGHSKQAAAMREAAKLCARSEAPLFSETQFIIENPAVLSDG